ncbi:bifunctional folylpolyglutamate synthase/dihydrofolate synthase [Acidithiobacillus sp. CV18-2]|uniref:Dihydrofolate synthase/folylpolyglutamate synthase n=1 Tax=Igneacidithiobacillus copahuensis TaxID=2724909 RepID=A0AAE2YSE6_9PROT|nr:cyanophycin synthetase [Igneacidithiobacillus copahuensis]MBU2755630.1 bifunctional folylpolyglutamate synthase/dihydrofolate synthase [Acidithiobacillus sp. CV18-3]MBU2758024.1 bifunctional folylpolyglutamate synthase/dihydrofolate synthase [Acidithiobacillus sp. BN09-2]MBU2777378.1 bifunctional folylpolyglutamate synthase/dihydrofolate synthase [Acidithiobacillus sp. CV18-2]MBU2796880.1 bifunctional folylpolyglutamate synthase/dihydrofolate synthase [Acidithiobacillus sp. VAN18-2]MBU27993
MSGMADAEDAESLLQRLAGSPQRIELGLERMHAAMQRLGIPANLPFPVITVAGTNGKGSVLAYLEALYQQSGYRCAAYSSPHIWRFAERLRVAGAPLPDRLWREKFAALASLAGEIPLTYFELSTLAALLLCLDEAPDLAILEVGLGGRLDAVNAVDADIAIISSIDLDHQALLGPDRESIGREKAGILRSGRPVLYGDRESPCASVLTAAEQRAAPLWLLGRDFDLDASGCWQAGATSVPVPPPMLDSAAQRANLALALAAVYQLRARLPQAWPPQERWRFTPRLLGRSQWLRPWGEDRPRLLVDVAHNPQAVRALAATLAGQSGRIFACWGMMADKDLAASVAPLRAKVDAWALLAMPDNPRAASPAQLRAELPGAEIRCELSLIDLPEHLRRWAAELGSDDILLCFGSFHVLSALPSEWFGHAP